MRIWFKSLMRNINLLNVLLISIIVLFSMHILYPVLGIRISFTLPVAKKIVQEKEESDVQSRTPSIEEYSEIPENNLFHPERKIPAEKKEEQALPKPDFVLYGTLIAGDISLAYVEDLKAPRSTPGRGKRQTALRKGDTLSGFTLKDIEPDAIVMVRGEEKIVVPVIDPSHIKDRTPVVTTAPASPQPTGRLPEKIQPGRQRRPIPNFRPNASGNNAGVRRLRSAIPPR